VIGPAEFSRVRWREGYAPEEVDAFVERLAATLNGHPIGLPMTPEDVRNVSFTPVRLREGYSVDEVDQFLDLAESKLREQQR
jgi:DivIVA domain-containing protein